MPLSEEEKRTFALLEAQLRENDPKFAKTMQSASTVGRISQRRIVIGSLIAVLGIAILLTGITIDFIVLGIAGFIIMGAGVYYAGTKVAGPPLEQGSKKNPKDQSGFMKRLEDNWEIRRQREGM